MMKKLGLLFCLLAVAAGTRAVAEEYTLGPDSQRQPGVPQGTVTHYTWTSKIFPGTTRDYWVYVPAQYSKDKPACVMVFQDGAGFIKEDGSSRVPIVFDNLIAKHEMPVTIGIFINPGVLKASSPHQQDRFNRSFEYDGMSDRYARFLLDEILPEVAKSYNLSTNPDDRAISGLSSGGICAFTVAWNRPDAFHRVLSFIGSFTDLRGGDVYPGLIRKTEPKPLRVFLQDGSNDLNIYAGSWWLANQSVASALEWAGYDVKFVTGDKDHDMIQGGAILPDALRWLWRDYPMPINKPAPNHSGDPRLAILDPASSWELVNADVTFNSGLAVDKWGNVYFSSSDNGQIEMIGYDTTGIVPGKDSYGAGMMFGADSSLTACQPQDHRIVSYTSNGKERVVTDHVGCFGLAVTKSGGTYFTGSHDKVWFIDIKGRKRIAFEGPIKPTGVYLSPDQSLLDVTDAWSKWVMSFQIEPDGSLVNGEPFYHLETQDESSASGAVGMTVDSLGYLYVATYIGIQVCDQPGRVVAIINQPNPEAEGGIVSVAFGGPDLQDLYAVDGGKLFKRHMLRKGVLPWVPEKPPVPHL
jgi:gluconolactonase